MPIIESSCERAGCQAEGVVVEHYYPHHDSALPDCPYCETRHVQRVSRFGVIWTGPITAKYNDHRLENSSQEGHYVWTRKTKDGKPEPRFISSFSEQKAFCKEEGLVNPSSCNVPTNAQISSDGKSVSERGLSGQWV